jgi:hypothetical protein
VGVASVGLDQPGSRGLMSRPATKIPHSLTFGRSDASKLSGIQICCFHIRLIVRFFRYSVNENVSRSFAGGQLRLMGENGIIRNICKAFGGRRYQSLAILFCVLLGFAMIINTQLAGEATWFWYATLFHNGAKLYADLHLALQPLLILEMDVWMKLFGIKCLVTEIPSALHLLVLCLGLFLLLRESDWPDWQKAIVLASAFVLWVAGTSYRFDDYHVTTESFILYSAVMLLLLAKADSVRRQFVLAAVMGALCGFTITSRINDGAALLATTSVCLLVLARKRKFLISSLFVVTSVLTAILVVESTGDSFSDYLSNSLFRAVGSKGGTGSLLAAPFLLFGNALEMRHGGMWILFCGFAIVAVGVLAKHFWKSNIEYIVIVQLLAAGVIFAVLSHQRREQLRVGLLIQFAVPLLIVAVYLLALVVAARYAMGKLSVGKCEWDAREILLLLPLAESASNSASGAATPLSGYYAQFAMLLLLIPVIQPFRKQASWINASFLTFLVLVGLSGVAAKIRQPYEWNSHLSGPMFVNRQWYRHPVYGLMYMEPGQLQLSRSICADIGGENSNAELLSLPFSYPNYFCDIRPWHGYVHTFFDTTLRSTMNELIRELQTGPPQWIVYQRQLVSIAPLEKLFNHGQPSVHRDLDEMIMQKIATGQWQLVEKKVQDADSTWYIIRTGA